jgi:hypothetical protein
VHDAQDFLITRGTKRETGRDWLTYPIFRDMLEERFGELNTVFKK